MEKTFSINDDTKTYTTKQVIDCIVQEDNYTTDDYDNMLDECYGDADICGIKFNSCYALKHLDEVAYRCGFLDYIDGMMQDDAYDLERLLDNMNEGDEDEYKDFTIVCTYNPDEHD